jgi:hypothetical protein
MSSRSSISESTYLGKTIVVAALTIVIVVVAGEINHLNHPLGRPAVLGPSKFFLGAKMLLGPANRVLGQL